MFRKKVRETERLRETKGTYSIKDIARQYCDMLVAVNELKKALDNVDNQNDYLPKVLQLEAFLNTIERNEAVEKNQLSLDEIYKELKEKIDNKDKGNGYDQCIDTVMKAPINDTEKLTKLCIIKEYMSFSKKFQKASQNKETIDAIKLLQNSLREENENYCVMMNDKLEVEKYNESKKTKFVDLLKKNIVKTLKYEPYEIHHLTYDPDNSTDYINLMINPLKGNISGDKKVLLIVNKFKEDKHFKMMYRIERLCSYYIAKGVLIGELGLRINMDGLQQAIKDAYKKAMEDELKKASLKTAKGKEKEDDDKDNAFSLPKRENISHSCPNLESIEDKANKNLLTQKLDVSFTNSLQQKGDQDNKQPEREQVTKNPQRKRSPIKRENHIHGFQREKSHTVANREESIERHPKMTSEQKQYSDSSIRKSSSQQSESSSSSLSKAQGPKAQRRPVRKVVRKPKVENRERSGTVISTENQTNPPKTIRKRSQTVISPENQTNHLAETARAKLDSKSKHKRRDTISGQPPAYANKSLFSGQTDKKRNESVKSHSYSHIPRPGKPNS